MQYVYTLVNASNGPVIIQVQLSCYFQEEKPKVRLQSKTVNLCHNIRLKTEHIDSKEPKKQIDEPKIISPVNPDTQKQRESSGFSNYKLIELKI